MEEIVNAEKELDESESCNRFLFFPRSCVKQTLQQTHLRNLSCNRYRKNDPGARSYLQQMDKTSSSILLSLAQMGWDLNGFEWHLRDFMAHHDKGHCCLPPNSLQGYTEPQKILIPALLIPTFLAQ